MGQGLEWSTLEVSGPSIYTEGVKISNGSRSSTGEDDSTVSTPPLTFGQSLGLHGLCPDPSGRDQSRGVGGEGRTGVEDPPGPVESLIQGPRQ